jgi:hypothetical protein
MVPRHAACSSPGCPYVHRWCRDLSRSGRRETWFRLADEAISVIDRLETGAAGHEGPYMRERITVVSLDGDGSYAAQAYVAREPARWRALVQIGEADALDAYAR